MQVLSYGRCKQSEPYLPLQAARFPLFGYLV